MLDRKISDGIDDCAMTTVEPDTLRLAAIVKASDDAIISHSLEGIIESWNPAAERMFGYSAADILGRSIDLIVADERREEERRLIDEVRRGSSVHHFETVGITRHGSSLDLSLSLSPLVTPEGDILGIARIIRDISHEKLNAREVARLGAIVDSADDAIVSKDLNGIVRSWNKAAEQMFGFSADEMIGRSITTIIPADRLPEEEEVLRRIRSGHSVRLFETMRQRKDGSLVEISLTVSPIRSADGRIIGASKIARDITAQRRLARAAEEANRVKDEFLAMLSHELRTPLNAVLGYTRMLRTGQVSEDRQERAIDTIERNANVLSQLVSDVLDVSAIVTGKMKLKTAPCDLRTLAEAATDVVRPTADAKGVALTINAPDYPVVVQCDGDRLQQVFWNLLANAVKFTPPEGKVGVDLTVSGGHARLSVSDTGVGIAKASLPYIFQRFWQGEQRVQIPNGGLGLGLSLARHFTELHGGTIKAASPGEGQGSTFTVELPLLRAVPSTTK
jgi:PAS domain S-box-containing protein